MDWTQEEIETVKKQYEDKVELSLIASNIGRTKKAIVWKMNNLGITRKYIKNKEEIIRMYSEGMSLPKISKLTGYTTGSLANMMYDKGVVLRSNQENSQKYSVNRHFFDIIDNEEKAYFLGLLYADGYVREEHNRNFFRIVLQDEDAYILEKFREAIQSESPIRFAKGQSSKHKNTAVFVVYNKHLANKLKQLGCVENKSLVLTFPEWLDPKLYNHFIRGYFDGDGCICTTKTDNLFNMVGTKDMMGRIQEIIMDNCKLNKTKLLNHKSDNICVLAYGGRNNCKKFAEWLYKDSSIFLQRKFEKFRKL